MGAVAAVAIVVAIAALGSVAGDQLARWIRAACDGHATLAPGQAVGAVLELALPLLAAAALAAVAAHLAQVRTLWLPRRRLRGAPAVDHGAAARTRRATFELASAAVVGGVATGWLWLVAPRLAALPEVPLAGASLVASALAAFAIAWIALGALDALGRHAALARALRMSHAEKREDDRLAGADPRWSRRRREVARDRESIAEAMLIVLGDDRAIAIAWDPVRRPVPARIASGSGPRVAQLLGLARRYAIPVHRDPALATTLHGTGPVPEAAWPRLAAVIAASGRR